MKASLFPFCQNLNPTISTWNAFLLTSRSICCCDCFCICPHDGCCIVKCARLLCYPLAISENDEAPAVLDLSIHRFIYVDGGIAWFRVNMNKSVFCARNYQFTLFTATVWYTSLKTPPPWSSVNFRSDVFLLCYPQPCAINIPVYCPVLTCAILYLTEMLRSLIR